MAIARQFGHLVYIPRRMSCFQNPWWRVDLRQVEPVNEVYIVNRGDCCGDRLNPFEIRVGKTKLHEALLKIINRYKSEKMNRTYYKHIYPFDEKPTYLQPLNSYSSHLKISPKNLRIEVLEQGQFQCVQA